MSAVIGRVLAAVAAGAVVLGVTPAAPAATVTAAVTGPVVLIGTGGLRWDDVNETTPALSSLQNADSIGLLAVRNVRATTCPIDGWLAVSAGRRAADTEADPSTACRQTPAPTIGTAGGTADVPRWSDYAREARSEDFDAHPGLLGETLRAAGKTAVAVGSGAAIALATPSSKGTTATVDHAFAGAVDGTAGEVDPQQLANDVQKAVALDPELLVIDVGAIRDPKERSPGEPKATGAYTSPRADQVARLDTRVGLVLGELPATATVIFASLADSGKTSQLRAVAARGPAPAGGAKTSYGGSLLGSRSTRQDGLTQGTDILPTLLAALGVDRPSEAVGAPIVPERTKLTLVGRLRKLQDLDQASTAVHPIVPWFFNGLVIAQVLLYSAATLALRRRREGADAPAAGPRRRRRLVALRRTAVVFACVPAATFLANLTPWWRAGHPGLMVTLAVAGFTLPIALVALTGPWRNAVLGPLGAVGGMTAGVLALDAATGSHLTLSSLMGVQPVVAGRFYGFGNVAFALFATGALLLAISLADAAIRRDRRPLEVAGIVAVIGVVATVIDGTPGLGSDFGGPPALIPAFGVLALMAAGVGVTWRRAGLIVLATVGTLLVISVADWLRPAESRTHLGRFVQTVLDGGGWTVIQRKAEQNFGILIGSWLTLLLPFAVAFVALVLARPVSWGVRPLQLAYDRSPALRPGMISFAVLIGLGFLLNDSGTAIPAVAATVAIPLLIAASVRALELDDATRLQAAIAKVRKSTARRR